MANPGDFAYSVKQQADIVRIVGEYVKLRKSGAQNYTGLCPFHNEKTGSFSVHATRQFYHCFGCGESGDIFKFVQKIENITFPEAVRLVAQKLGIPLPKVQFSSPEEAREASMRGKLLEIHERACAWFQEQLRRPEAAHAREYLKGRGLSDENLVQFRIGFAPESGFLLRDRLKSDFDEDVMRASGLFSWKEEQQGKNSPMAMYSKFRNRVTFPICNESGRVIAFTGRTLVADEKAGPKYLNSPETPIYSKSHVLFNVHLAKEAIRRLDYVILVEGQMDCISVFAAGMHNIIATSGTAFTEPQVRLLARHTRNIVVNFDPDAAGAAAAERSLTMLLQEDFNIKVVTLEAGYDPDLYVRKRGVAAYANALKTAPRYFDYLIERARTQFPVRTAEGKVKALNFLLPFIQRVPNRIARDEIANEVAQKLTIDSAVLRQELRHVAAARTATKVNAPPQVQVTEAERILIRALAGSELSAENGQSSREGEEHAFDPARQVRFVLEAERLHAGLGTEALIDSLLKAEDAGGDPMSLPIEEADRRLVAEVLMHEEEELTPELLEQTIAVLRRMGLEHRQRDLNVRIREAEQKQDIQGLAQLLREKRDLDRALATKRPG